MKKSLTLEKANNICAALSAVLAFLSIYFSDAGVIAVRTHNIIMWVAAGLFLLTPGWYKNRKIRLALLLPILFFGLEIIKKGSIPSHLTTLKEARNLVFFATVFFALCFRLRGERREQYFLAVLAFITFTVLVSFWLSLFAILRGRNITLCGALNFGAVRSASGKLTFKCMAFTAYQSGLYAAALAFVAVFLYVRLKNRRLLPLFILSEATFITVLWLSACRSALLSFAVGTVVLTYILISRKVKDGAKKKRILIIATAGIFGAILAAIPLIYASVGSGQTTLYGITSFANRTTIWSSLLKMFRERPLALLTGLPRKICHSVMANYIPLDTDGLTAHSGNFETLCLMGLPGFLLMLIYTFGIASASAWTVLKKDPSGKSFARKPAVPVLAVIFVQNLFEVVYFVGTLTLSSILFAMLAGYILFFEEETAPLPCDPLSANGDMACAGEDAAQTGRQKKTSRIAGVITAAIPVLLLVLSPFGKDNTIIVTIDPDNSASGPGVTEAQQSAEHWTTAEGDTVLMNAEEIDAFNEENRAMIELTKKEKVALKDIDGELPKETVWSIISGSISFPEYPREYLLNGKPTGREYWEGLFENRNLPGEKGTVAVRYGFSVGCTTIRRLPTRDAVYTYADKHAEYLDKSDFYPCQPVAVCWESADGEWYFVFLYGYAGWIEKKYVALCDSREEWLAAQEPEQFLVVTGGSLTVDYTDASGAERSLALPMGTKLALDTGASPQSGYAVLLPLRGESGSLVYAHVTLPPDADVSEGYLPYTSNAVIRQAFKLQGVRYGFYDETDEGYDCSAMLRAVYACFGFELPRTSAAQASAFGIKEQKEERSEEEKLKILAETTPGTPLYFEGHIMIYLGMDDGVPYAISALSSYVQRNPETQIRERVYSLRAMVSDMVQTLRLKGNSWVSACVIG